MIKLYKGDNAEILANKINNDTFNIVYLDPPYNTHNGNMSYTDNQKDWKGFFKKRLVLIKKLLEKDAVIFTSIGNEELANAKLVLDEIFGKNSFVAIMPRLTNKVSKTTQLISRINDFVIINKVGKVVFNGKKINFASSYKLKDEHFSKRGFYQLRRLDYNDFKYSKRMDFPVFFQNKSYYPDNFGSFRLRKQNFKQNDWCWLWSEAKINFAIKADYLEVKNGKLCKKTYTKCEIFKNKNAYSLKYKERTQPYSSLDLTHLSYINYNREAFEDSDFTYPKNSSLIKFLFELPRFSNKKILDPFAGTGVSGVIANKMGAKCTLIQLSEKTKSKSNLNFNGFKDIFDLTKDNLQKEQIINLEIHE